MNLVLSDLFSAPSPQDSTAPALLLSSPGLGLPAVGLLAVDSPRSTEHQVQLLQRQLQQQEQQAQAALAQVTGAALAAPPHGVVTSCGG